MVASPYGPTAIVKPEVPVVLEGGGDDWGAYVPSIPVCAARGRSREEVLRNIERALTEHLRDLHQDAIHEEIAQLTAERTESSK